MQRIRVEETPDGAYVHKCAADGTRTVGLQHEADVLARFAHPGLVQLVGLQVERDVAILTTRHAGHETLADFHPENLAQAAALLSKVATTLADLHRAGVVHGAVQADHVVLGPHRRPILCSLGRANAEGAGEPADLAGLADLVVSLTQRTQRPHGRRAGIAYDRRLGTLLTLAADLQLDTVAERPSASRAAERLADEGRAATVDPQLPTPASKQVAAPLAQGTRTWRDRVEPVSTSRSAAAGIGAVGAAALIVAAFICGFFATRGMDRFSTSSTMIVAPAEAMSKTDVVVSVPRAGVGTRLGDIAPGQRPCSSISSVGVGCTSSCTLQATQGFDVDGDGCDDHVQVHGHMISARGQWYRAGAPGDTAVLGDWDCNGTDTVALLRGTTGEVFVFTTWVHGGERIDVQAVATVAGASSIYRQAAATDCDQLMATTLAGDTIEILQEQVS